MATDKNMMPVMCGVAITAPVETITAEDHGGLNEAFVDLCEAIASQDGPSVVVFQEVGARPDFSAHSSGLSHFP